jgi:hypothetical protein
MPLTKHDTHAVYTITGPEWTCEWVVFYNKSIPIRRSFMLTSPHEYNETTLQTMPGLLENVRNQVNQWIMQGDIDANLLLLPQNTPEFLLYAIRYECKI